MAREVREDPVGMLTTREADALVEALGLMHTPPHARVAALGYIGIAACVAEPPVPPLTTLGWGGREVAGIRVEDAVLLREEGEGYDEFKIRASRELGGVGRVGHFLYRKGTR